MQNYEIKKEIRTCGFYQWEIANKLGVSEMTLIRWLRIELTEDKKTLIRSAIKELKEGAL